MNKFSVVVITLMCLVMTACESPDGTGQVKSDVTPTPPHVPVVYTVNYPLAWMAGQITGQIEGQIEGQVEDNSVEVIFPVPTGIDPAHWQPAAEDILLYQQADRVLLNGTNYASWVSFAALSSGRLVDTTAGADERFVPLGAVTHTHGPSGAHEHGNVATHTWLDPMLAVTQAAIVADTLIDLLPEKQEMCADNLSGLMARFGLLDTMLAEGFSGWSEKGVLYSHPVYQYLDQRYALNGRSLVWEPDQIPAEEEWRKLAAMLAVRPATIMLWEAEPSAETISHLKRLGITTIVFEVCGNRPAAGDYLQAMDANLKRIQAVK
jgi:zinc transport system substrate-binding protein